MFPTSSYLLACPYRCSQSRLKTAVTLRSSRHQLINIVDKISKAHNLPFKFILVSDFITKLGTYRQTLGHIHAVHSHQKFHHTHYLYPRTPFYNTFLLFHTMSIALAFYCIRTSNPFPYFEVQLKYMILRGKIKIKIRLNFDLVF